ncbi:hypothetical protein [Profundibacterium mesophilum]|uniref:Uncharacterized protein n=1 Tax=Profundibacterium mesophilum KAUST100406-0324 TaxID=1037889 RepID=A0A921NNK4_9RHOB|nr:hypothetical protein [Profundibacterium mesophilum]KAF0675036.1 hypothetical protein PMES_02745 [Profundibacterium mesophilum KAUST100406-0324]
MSGLDRVKMPENRRWILSVVAAVVFIMCMMLSASWWVGAPISHLVIAAVVSLAIGLFVGMIAARRGRKRR